MDKEVQLAGWVQRVRKLGGMTFIDLRDRYGITQLAFNESTNKELYEQANGLNREYVLQATGKVIERSSKNPDLPTGGIEIEVDRLTVLNPSETPPFTIEDETDGGEDLRLKYRYLDLRRRPMRNKLELRHRMALEIRKYLDGQGFMEIETPMLIKSTPEGARDFVVPSRMHAGQFYALPQSPQTFKQLLMVSGYDRYFQIVKCFRDEDFRADRQPEFTQLDCEMAFVEQDDILNTFEGLARHMFRTFKKVEIEGGFPRMSYQQAVDTYGNDKPDLRFGMPLHEITGTVQGKGFKVFDQAEYAGAVCAAGAANYSRKQLDALTDWVRRPQIGALGLIYVKCNEDGSFKSSVDKFFDQDALKDWAGEVGAKAGDLILVLSGPRKKTQWQLGELRLEMGRQLELIDPNSYKPLWVTDFPMFEWDGETQRHYAMHHPFTSPVDEDLALLDSEPGKVRAKAYDFVINGQEIGGGSIRIHDKEIQAKVFKALGFTDEEARKQFGFLMDAFRYGAPPHGGIAYGLDRWVALFAGTPSIRDVMAFPKNNAGRDLMIESPASISAEQLKELQLALNLNKKEE